MLFRLPLRSIGRASSSFEVESSQRYRGDLLLLFLLFVGSTEAAVVSDFLLRCWPAISTAHSDGQKIEQWRGWRADELQQMLIDEERVL